MTEKPASYPAKMNRGMAKKVHTRLLPLLVMPSKAIVGIVRVGKEAQVSHSGGMSDFHLRKDLLGRSDILTS